MLKTNVKLEGADELLKQLKKLGQDLSDAPSIKVGVPQEGSYPDGTPIHVVGFVNEFGSEGNNIPERSFLRSTVHENADEYANMLINGAKAYVDGKVPSMDVVANLVGIKVESDVKEKIFDLKDPANAESTIKKKKSDNPLIDTGLLRSSIIYEVGDEEGGN